MKLDDYDLKILQLLQRNGRMTKLRLAEAISLSPSACWERLLRLEQAGIIRSYHADIDLDRLLRTVVVWVELTLKRHQAHDFARFEATVRELPAILECYAIGGGVDYLLKIVARDIDDYQALIDDLLQADVGIDRYFTYIVTKQVKRPTGYPLRELLAGQAPRDPNATNR
ncbi:MAG: Lrp/AsnC family transcriptional regulator [Candidatus Competibacterales bacterium]|nr:Lrp/AsnC family transcriptional regulator [Candidatus Competibacterales bacterium]